MKAPRGLVLGWAHPVTLGALFLIGLGLLRVSTPPPAWILTLAPSIPPDRWWNLLGVYLLVVAASHVVVHPVVAVLREWLTPETLPTEREPKFYLPPVLVGACESVLFSTALATDNAEFIAVWLGLKVAGGWNTWQEGHKGRTRFQVFLIGNALCIATAFVGFKGIAAVLR